MAEANEKAYVLVRSDISKGYQIVQTAHAVAEHEKAYPGSMAGRTMVVLSVPTAFVLALFKNWFVRQDIPVTMFFEPDIGQFTALAISPNSRSVDAFDGMPLAGS